MMRNPLKVMIIGAGTGGLCLAHGLKSDNVAVEVFERDYTPSDRLQGYRLSLSATGSVAVSGKFGLNDDTRAITPQPILRGPTLILGPRGCFMFGSAIDYGDGSDKGTTGSTAHDPLPYDREEYVMWGFSAHRETFA